MGDLYINDVPDEYLFKLRELKAEWRCKTWKNFIEELLRRHGKIATPFHA
ncbi:MAG: hypothetical protein ACE5Z5_09535 [Candidatus Bathyarchaeia archaeon]